MQVCISLRTHLLFKTLCLIQMQVDVEHNFDAVHPPISSINFWAQAQGFSYQHAILSEARTLWIICSSLTQWRRPLGYCATNSEILNLLSTQMFLPNWILRVLFAFRVQCSIVENCTHYSWTSGRCEMRTGSIRKSDAIMVASNETICGYIPVQWHGLKYAISCLFNDNPIAAVKGPGDSCIQKCDEYPGCTHFTWNKTDSGTCFLQGGEISEADAFYVHNFKSVCGFCKTCLGQ